MSHGMSNVRTRFHRITRLQHVPRTPGQAHYQHSRILDAEEARGSNPLAPTTKGPASAKSAGDDFAAASEFVPAISKTPPRVRGSAFLERALAGAARLLSRPSSSMTSASCTVPRSNRKVVRSTISTASWIDSSAAARSLRSPDASQQPESDRPLASRFSRFRQVLAEQGRSAVR